MDQLNTAGGGEDLEKSVCDKRSMFFTTENTKYLVFTLYSSFFPIHFSKPKKKKKKEPEFTFSDTSNQLSPLSFPKRLFPFNKDGKGNNKEHFFEVTQNTATGIPRIKCTKTKKLFGIASRSNTRDILLLKL